MRRHVSALLVLLFLAGQSRADNWPAWRGPAGTGVSTERGLPISWSAGENIRWKAPLPGPGNSTPIVWGDRVFLTQALDGGAKRALVAFDRATGKTLWRHEVPCDVQETTHKQNPPCSASAVTDGAAVYAHFASAGVIACDFEGKLLWSRNLGPVLHKWGNGGSPILYKDLLIVSHGPGEPTFLIALDKRTGETVWKKDETAINSNIFGSWSTPVVVNVNGRDEMIMPLPGDKVGGVGYFKAYDPATGAELWRCDGLGNEIYAMPVVSPKGDVVVGISGHNGPVLAVRPGGSGDVTAKQKLWQVAGKNPQRVGSGIIHEGRLYLADAPGFIQCLDAKTGEPLWKERLEGNLWGSLLLADGKLYATTLEGTTYILGAGPKFELLGKNELKEDIYAAPAVSNGELFLRTYKHLYCIARADGEPRDKKDASVQTKGLRVFSAGHSFHYFMPPILTDIARSAAIKDHNPLGLQPIGGSRVIQHWNVPDEKNKVKEALRTGKVDVLTLSPIHLPDEGIENFVGLALEHNPKVRVTVQEFWLPFDIYDTTFKERPKTVDHNARTADELRKLHAPYFKSMDDHVRELNKKMGKEVVYVAPVGQAVIALREKIIDGQAPGLTKQSDLFTDPIGHAKPPLMALVAYVHYATLYGKSPVGLPVPAILAKAPEKEKLNHLLQELAWQAVIAHPLSGVKAARPAPSPKLKAKAAGRPGEINTPAAKAERVADKLKVGDAAPDFTLPRITSKEEVSLSGLRGKPVVLIFASYT